MSDLSASLWVLCTLSAIVPGWTQQTTPPTSHSNPNSGLKFRLAGFPRKHNEGRIEVFYNQEWGTICDDDFTMENAHILCRHLGFTEATGWTHSAKYGKGIGRIWLDNVICSGSEKSIADCTSRGWGSTDCTHEEDAGVICKDERIPGYVEPNTIETEQRQLEEVRLRPVITSAKNRLPIHEGILEIKYRDTWEQVCDVGWTPANSLVVCGMLGFPSEKKFNKNFYKEVKTSANKKRSTKTCVLFPMNRKFVRISENLFIRKHPKYDFLCFRIVYEIRNFVDFFGSKFRYNGNRSKNIGQQKTFHQGDERSPQVTAQFI
ncbi:hypothetical protein AB205_0143410 [Aquarana catesbeiana]|uniref:SRCR domain-containing protein n=1 Tax=Aquarana catesbeiana TaxID=8400 RepID=A0A2G9RFD3_AQUCT|nr:hypothetical protein AB205_0143410 [Aquarana catesbeiana]